MPGGNVWGSVQGESFPSVTIFNIAFALRKVEFKTQDTYKRKSD